MTPEDCRKILANLEIIKHVAYGGEIEHALHDYKGNFVEWTKPTTKVLINCLGNYRIVKKRYRLADGESCYEVMDGR